MSEKKKKKENNQMICLMKKKNQNSIENHFFKYAFPCAQVKVKLGSLTPEEYEKLRIDFLQGDCPDKDSLEKLFPPAFRRIGKLAEKMGKEKWDEQVIKHYWKQNHNEVIDEGEGMYGIASESFKDLCKIHVAKVEEIEGNYLIVNYNGKKRVVSSYLVPDVKIKDKVTIHFAHAIEKV